MTTFAHAADARNIAADDAILDAEAYEACHANEPLSPEEHIALLLSSATDMARGIACRTVAHKIGAVRLGRGLLADAWVALYALEADAHFANGGCQGGGGWAAEELLRLQDIAHATGAALDGAEAALVGPLVPAAVWVRHHVAA